MAGFYGGDTDQMRQHGTACQQGSQRIVDITEATTALIDSVTWQGPDAVAFRALWHDTVEPGMLARADDIGATGREIDQHAEQQDQASGGDGGEGLLKTVGDHFRDIFGPGGVTGPLIGHPLTPGVLDVFRNSVMTGGQRPGQEMYGTDGYLDAGGAAGTDRPLGGYHDEFSVWDGREAEGELGHFDAYGRGGYSFGANESIDEFGNVTGTAGGRTGAEIGFDGELNGAHGSGGNVSGAVGVEAYAEGGGTVGPDGYAFGAQAGGGAYAEGNITAENGQGGTSSVTGTAYAGADIGGNHWNQATRNEDGAINGWTVGFDGRAFAGAEAGLDFQQSGPFGWFSGHTSVDAKAGVGGGGGAGLTLSTDEIGFGLSGELATGLGLGASHGLSIHPNQIVETFSPGEYDLDDMISDVGSATSDWWDDHNPF